MIRILFLTMALTSACALAQTTAAPPPVRAANETFFGTEVRDPYRWLEDVKSPEVATWMKTQSDYTMSLLSRIPGRQAMFERVEVWHSTKTAARLMAAQAGLSGGSRPVLLRLDFDAGHGIGSTKTQLQERADMFTFFLWQMGVEGYQPMTAAK